MPYYDPRRDLLYAEAELGPDLIDLVDLIRHSAYVIREGARNPYTVRSHEIRLSKSKAAYSFFTDSWAAAAVVSGLLDPDEKGLDISDVHIANLIYGMRQNVYLGERDGVRRIGWYLDPAAVLCGTLPAVFEDFQEAYSRAGGRNGAGRLALQSRNNDFMGRVAYDFGEYVRRNFDPTAPLFKEIVVTPAPA